MQFPLLGPVWTLRDLCDPGLKLRDFCWIPQHLKEWALDTMQIMILYKSLQLHYLRPLRGLSKLKFIYWKLCKEFMLLLRTHTAHLGTDFQYLNRAVLIFIDRNSRKVQSKQWNLVPTGRTFSKFSFHQSFLRICSLPNLDFAWVEKS